MGLGSIAKQRFTVSLNNSAIQDIYVVQNDTNSRIYEFQILDINEELLDISNISLTLGVDIGDGKIILATGEKTDLKNSIFTVSLNTEQLIDSGMKEAQLIFSENNRTIRSKPFKIYVYTSVFEGGTYGKNIALDISSAVESINKASTQLDDLVLGITNKSEEINGIKEYLDSKYKMLVNLSENELERIESEKTRKKNEELRKINQAIIQGWINDKSQFNGKSAYEIWLELGNQGSKEDFINSLGGTQSVDDLKLKVNDLTNELRNKAENSHNHDDIYAAKNHSHQNYVTQEQLQGTTIELEKATHEKDGIMSKEDKVKLDDINKDELATKEELDNKANKEHNHDDKYQLKGDMNIYATKEELNSKSAITHTHDERYQLKGDYADKVHTHSGLISKAEFDLNIGDKNSLKTASKNTIVSSINEVFQSVSNGKEKIASAITDKGVQTEATDSFDIMKNNIGKIKTGYTSGDIIPLENIKVHTTSSGWASPIWKTEEVGYHKINLINNPFLDVICYKMKNGDSIDKLNIWLDKKYSVETGDRYLRFSTAFKRITDNSYFLIKDNHVYIKRTEDETFLKKWVIDFDVDSFSYDGVSDFCYMKGKFFSEWMKINIYDGSKIETMDDMGIIKGVAIEGGILFWKDNFLTGLIKGRDIKIDLLKIIDLFDINVSTYAPSWRISIIGINNKVYLFWEENGGLEENRRFIVLKINLETLETTKLMSEKMDSMRHVTYNNYFFFPKIFNNQIFWYQNIPSRGIIKYDENLNEISTPLQVEGDISGNFCILHEDVYCIVKNEKTIIEYRKELIPSGYEVLI